MFVGGASLVAPGAVLTAAHKVALLHCTALHCTAVDQVAGRDVSQLVVRCGEWDTQTEGEPLLHQDRLVSKVLFVLIQANKCLQVYRHDQYIIATLR